MSNKTELQANNVELQEILDSVNALPDAGSDTGGLETCTLTVNYTDGAGWGLILNEVICATNENGIISTNLHNHGGDYFDNHMLIANVIKDTPIYIAFEHAGMKDNVYEVNGCNLIGLTINEPFCIIYASENEAIINITAN